VSFSVLSAAAAIALSVSTASAQNYPPSGYSQPSGSGYDDNGPPQRPNAGYGDQGQGGYGPPPSQGQQSGPGQASQGGTPDLRRALRLRPDQQAAYRTYQAQIAPDPAETQRQRADAARIVGAPTPQRLDMIARQLQRDQTDFARRADVVRRFYATLTPQQQRAFDLATAPPSEPDQQGGQPSDAGPVGYGQDGPPTGYGGPQGRPQS